MTDYPSDYPKPLADSWSQDVRARITRMSMDAGNTKQRRLSWSMPEEFNLTFAVLWKDFNAWMNWVNLYAYDWFNLPVVNTQSTASDVCNSREVRFISDPTITQGDGDFVYVSVLAEARGLGVNQELNNRGWIIGGTPGNPSPDWIIAGTPANPSDDDIVIAGTPESPAVYI